VAILECSRKQKLLSTFFFREDKKTNLARYRWMRVMGIIRERTIRWEGEKRDKSVLYSGLPTERRDRKVRSQGGRQG